MLLTNMNLPFKSKETHPHSIVRLNGSLERKYHEFDRVLQY